MPNPTEAEARIKIDELLKRAGWRLVGDKNGRADVRLETNIIFVGDNDNESRNTGFVDYLLLNKKGFPLAVLEAKRGNPLEGKEQARRYALSQKTIFVILSNGDVHYLWDLSRGNPEIITDFPTQESLSEKSKLVPKASPLNAEEVNEGYIAISQNPGYQHDPRYQEESTRANYISGEGLAILRPYQLDAIRALQKSAATGNHRFLFEMATGTGKTLVSGAVIKLFLRTGNARRILFLVDRLELEDQAYKNFVRYLGKDYTCVIYKQNRTDWRKAEIVISTVQSLSSQNKYKTLFSPIDFDLVISDEAHRSINGNSRAVFEYFTGYKLGLTATPRDYLRNIDPEKISDRDPRSWERRQLMDTYKTFGCESGEPTARYSLVDGVQHGYLINPITVDARTDITTELLSEKGYAVMLQNDEGEEVEEVFFHTDFERKFISEKTNIVFCRAIIENALQDPLSGEIGKTLVFCISQKHASKITQILNQISHHAWPGKYNSDFAVQVTSNIPNAQQMAVHFANNNLNGYTKFLPGYKSSKTRVCATVGMMTTGYDCEDILNLALLRPVFSPTDFVQIKGRGTRKFTFKYEDENKEVHEKIKERFKFFDFFGNFEYFEEKFDYDEAIDLPQASIGSGGGDGDERPPATEIEVFNPDKLKELRITSIGVEGMRVDRELYKQASGIIRQDVEIEKLIEHGEWEKAVRIARERYENKPELYLTLEKIRKSTNLDRRLTWREFLEQVFGLIDRFKSRDEQLGEEADKFISIHKPESKYVPHIKNFLKVYVGDAEFRKQISHGEFPWDDGAFTMAEYKALDKWREIIPKYVKDYVSITQYTE